MKFRLSKSIASLICFTLVIVAIQSNETAWANRDLLKPGESGNAEMQDPVVNGTEGIEFTALTPDNPIEIPKEGGKPVPIQLGIKITNHSLFEREFFLSAGLPSFFNNNQKTLNISGGCDSTILVPISREKDFKILKPNKNIHILHEAFLYQRNGKIFISFQYFGMSCNFDGFTAGNYSVMMNYSSSYDPSWPEKRLWKRTVKSAAGKFNLSEKR
jgi:hypothetical protein